MDTAFVEQMKKKVEQELRTRETEIITFWKDEIEKIIDQCNEDDFIVAFNMLLRNFQLNKYFNRTVHNSTSHIASHTS